jgi:orotate phosphoribosyltransferase
LVQLLLARSVQHGSFTLASGRTSSYYIDARPSTMSAAGLELVGSLGVVAIRTEGWKPVSVGGLTLGADPVAYAVARASLGLEATINAFTVRKEAKGHGRGRRIEGCFASGDRVVVVEDVITSGSSALTAIDAVKSEGGVVLGVLAVIDREEGGRATIESAGYRVRALVTARDLGLTPQSPGAH